MELLDLINLKKVLKPMFSTGCVYAYLGELNAVEAQMLPESCSLTESSKE